MNVDIAGLAIWEGAREFIYLDFASSDAVTFLSNPVIFSGVRLYWAILSITLVRIGTGQLERPV
jgi:hypothetical protein